EDSTRDVLHHADLAIEDIDMFFMHQANIRIIDAAVDNLGIAREKVPVNLDRYGNTSAASIPILLDEVARSGKIESGDRIMLTGFGAGLAWGTVLLEW
ncbi:MAG: ketoacyl-ACP synthase III, partial [Planctomycetota bacterium]